ncbi:hypothetical protein AJ80_04116 [Polytolypa hystricis UAMH7299]|uniref:Uncharacterized protein n=1 Tax=Polytolypa hystricis (strain UAMH7299) TaxID=1447883 RepID=A0A2B7YDX0_POLH7|nr:hypothetical protein AJ80_04116 [Polytolypa hystricis UAMH7299]
MAEPNTQQPAADQYIADIYAVAYVNEKRAKDFGILVKNSDPTKSELLILGQKESTQLTVWEYRIAKPNNQNSVVEGLITRARHPEEIKIVKDKAKEACDTTGFLKSGDSGTSVVRYGFNYGFGGYHTS